MITIAIVLVSLTVLAIVGRKSVHAEILIPAYTSEVWDVLMDQEAYPAWNPVLIPVQGKLEEGSRLKYEFHQNESSVSILSARVKKVLEYELLNQAGGIPGILSFDHKYTLERQAGGTRVIIHEDYRGIWVLFWNPRPVEDAYDRMAKALKDRVINM